MYQVWTKKPYEETWTLTECPGLPEVEKILKDNFATDVMLKISLPVEYESRVVIKVYPPGEKLSAKEKFAAGIEGAVKEDRSEAKTGKPK